MGKTVIRVDDRLIHGQTVVAWCPTLGIKEIIAVDNASAKNAVLKSIMTMGVPKNYKTNIVTTEEAVEILRESSEDNRLVIVKFPEVLEDIADIVTECDEIILGNLAKRDDTVHNLQGATGIFYLSENDIVLLDNLSKKGFNIGFQQLPSTKRVSWESFKNSI